MDAFVTHRGGCHCGAVALEVDAPAVIRALDCNCSICRATGFQHLIVPKERFRLVRGQDALTEYQFGTRTARHWFCRTCGIKAFYVPRSHPNGYSVNVRCLEPATVSRVELERFDDDDREASTRRFAHLT